MLSQRNSRSLQRYLFASVSALTLAVAAPQVSAADLENPYLKAPPKGELNLFVEGGAYWTEGDPVYAPWGFAPNIFELKPNVGWVAAGGFDYRFAASP